MLVAITSSDSTAFTSKYSFKSRLSKHKQELIQSIQTVSSLSKLDSERDIREAVLLISNVFLATSVFLYILSTTAIVYILMQCAFSISFQLKVSGFN